MLRTFCVAVAVCGLCLSPSVGRTEEAPPAAVYDSVERYEPRELEGWQILIHKDLLEADRAELFRPMWRELENQLYRVTRVVPHTALVELRKIPIWVEVAHPKHPCMCYHPDGKWLADNGMNPEKAKGVELANCKNFINWTKDQPWMLLHELAHGYHDRVLSFEQAEVKAAYEKSMQLNRYDTVQRISGRQEKAYATTNPQEYFAEASEALFGTNDFYPYVRSELQAHDPDFYLLLRKLWHLE